MFNFWGSLHSLPSLVLYILSCHRPVTPFERGPGGFQIMTDKRDIQLIIAAVLTLAGIGLLYLGALLAPQGEIHETILVAFGEVATFAGSISTPCLRNSISIERSSEFALDSFA